MTTKRYVDLHALVVGGEDEDGNQLNSAESICIELSQLRTADGPPRAVGHFLAGRSFSFIL